VWFAISPMGRTASPLISAVDGELRARRAPLIMVLAPCLWRFKAAGAAAGREPTANTVNSPRARSFTAPIAARGPHAAVLRRSTLQRRFCGRLRSASPPPASALHENGLRTTSMAIYGEASAGFRKTRSPAGPETDLTGTRRLGGACRQMPTFLRSKTRRRRTTAPVSDTNFNQPCASAFDTGPAARRIHV
jgi:hypothetical protein